MTTDPTPHDTSPPSEDAAAPQRDAAASPFEGAPAPQPDGGAEHESEHAEHESAADAEHPGTQENGTQDDGAEHPGTGEAVAEPPVEAAPGDEETEFEGPVTVRPVNDGDFFDWLALYERYAAEHDTVLTDEKALRLWVWLGDPEHEENGLVAVAGDRIVGLVNFHEFSRPLASDRAIFIDDLYAPVSSRQQEVGSALIEAVRSWGANAGAGAVQWAATSDDVASWRRFDGVAEQSPRVTYELPVEPTGE